MVLIYGMWSIVLVITIVSTNRYFWQKTKKLGNGKIDIACPGNDVDCRNFYIVGGFSSLNFARVDT